jgi:hypothetical protein
VGAAAMAATRGPTKRVRPKTGRKGKRFVVRPLALPAPPLRMLVARKHSGWPHFDSTSLVSSNHLRLK